MIEWLDQTDKALMLFLNGFNSDLMDPVMGFITNKKTWYPAYGLLLIYLLYRHKSRGLYFVLVIVLTVVLSDQITSTLLKPNVGRLRPCHQEGFSLQIHRVGPCGGVYSFASGHSANSFALATIISLLVFGGQKKYYLALYIWAAIVAYSRVYVGVHFPGDIVFGAMLGILSGHLLFRLWNRVNEKYGLMVNLE